MSHRNVDRVLDFLQAHGLDHESDLTHGQHGLELVEYSRERGGYGRFVYLDHATGHELTVHKSRPMRHAC